ncbi:MAG: hypothetical protein ACHQIM_21775 [Sphingobacteriales bacterium]
MDSKIAFENDLGRAMLSECAVNNHIKDTLQSLADVLQQKILNPIIEATAIVAHFDEIKPVEFRAAITQLANMHSDQEKQYGGLLRSQYQTGNEITNDITKIHHLLTTLKQTLNNIKETATTADKMAQVIKVIVDLGYGYVEKLPNLRVDHKEPFDLVKSMIWPSPEEMNVRIMREERDKIPKYATQLGIGRDDLMPMEEAQKVPHFIAGKSVFLGIDIEERLKITAEEFDRINTKLKMALKAQDLVLIKKTSQEHTDFLEKQSTNFGSLWVAALTNRQDVPEGVLKAFLAMNPGEFQAFAKKFEPASIKLAKSIDSPLVATISGSAARPLIALQHLGAFYTNGKFDHEKAQILANCIMGLFVQAGHHSFLEVAESYNRLIDYIVLEQVEMLPEAASQKLIIESILPYFHAGDYESFLNINYREVIMPYKLNPHKQVKI